MQRRRIFPHTRTHEDHEQENHSANLAAHQRENPAMKGHHRGHPSRTMIGRVHRPQKKDTHPAAGCAVEKVTSIPDIYDRPGECIGRRNRAQGPISKAPWKKLSEQEKRNRVQALSRIRID